MRPQTARGRSVRVSKRRPHASGHSRREQHPLGRSRRDASAASADGSLGGEGNARGIKGTASRCLKPASHSFPLNPEKQRSPARRLLTLHMLISERTSPRSVGRLEAVSPESPSRHERRKEGRRREERACDLGTREQEAEVCTVSRLKG